MESATLRVPGGRGALATFGREAALVGLAMAVLYVLTMTGNHREAEDSLAYAAGIRSGGALNVLNQNHLAWGTLGWLFYNGARGLGLADSPLAALQVMDALIGALGVGILWRFLRGLGWDVRSAGGTCGLLAFSYGYWYYSGEAEVYILSALTLIGCLILAHRAALEPRPRSFALLGLANGAAVLAHDTNALFAVVPAAILAVRYRGLALRGVARCAAAFGAAAVAVVVPAYVAAAAAIGFGSWDEFYSWLTSYTSRGQWGHLAFSDLPKGAVGAGRALIGGHFIFALNPSQTLQPIGGGDQGQQLFLMRHFPDPLAILLIALGLAVLAVVLTALVTHLRARPWRGPGAGSTLDLVCVVWLVPYTLFFLWWEPLNLEFWIVWWIPAAILLGRRLAVWGRRGGPWRFALPAAVAGLAFVNLAGSILPQQSEGGDYWRQRALWYEGHARPTDLVLSNGYVLTNYIRYFGDVEAIDVQDVGSFRLNRLGFAGGVMGVLRNSPAHRLLISNQVFHPDSDAYASCHANDDCKVAAVLRPFLLPRARPIARTPLETVWQSRRPPGVPAKVASPSAAHVPHR